MKTPITKERIQYHFSYSWWKYAILAAIAVMGWSIIFSVTAYRPPEEKKVVLGIYAHGEEAIIDQYMAKMHAEHLPDMELIDAEFIMPDATYGDMILSTRIAARECDLYLLPREQFLSYAGQAGFMALEEVVPELVAELEEAGISLSRGWRTITDTNEKHLFGIPCTDLPGAPGLLAYDTSDMYLCLFFETGNDENAIKLFTEIVHDLIEAPFAKDPSTGFPIIE